MKRTERKDHTELRGWRPDLDESLSLPPAKRARVVSTTRLYEQLCAQVSIALHDRKIRDQKQRDVSRDLAERFPLTFRDWRSPEPAVERNTGLKTATSRMTPTPPHKKEQTDKDLNFLDLRSNPNKYRPEYVTICALRHVGCQEDMDAMHVPQLPCIEGLNTQHRS